MISWGTTPLPVHVLRLLQVPTPLKDAAPINESLIIKSSIFHGLVDANLEHRPSGFLSTILTVQKPDTERAHLSCYSAIEAELTRGFRRATDKNPS